jgi:hypothetical protein
MSAKNVKVLRAAHVSWNTRDFAGVIDCGKQDFAATHPW